MAALTTKGILEKVAQVFRDGLLVELEVQGYKIHADTKNKIKAVGIAAGAQSRAQVIGPEHLIFLNFPRKPGAKKIPINAILRFMKRAGFGGTGKEALSIAWAIQITIFQQGRPTFNSRLLSDNGKRTGFIEDSVREVEQKAKTVIETEAAKTIRAAFRGLR